MSDLIIRDAADADRPLIIGFMAGLQDFERSMEPNRRPGAEMAARHLAVLEDWAAEHPGGSNLVAEVQGQVIGWALSAVEVGMGFMVPESTRLAGLISDLWVEPEQRGKGIATALIHAAEARFVAEGIKRIEIAAVADNARAIALYRKLGFAPYELMLGKTL